MAVEKVQAGCIHQVNIRVNVHRKLARFAAQHADKFGRIGLILLEGTKAAKRNDLTDDIAGNKVKGIKLADQMKKLFNEA